jgi:hypothetical protein
MDGIISGEQFNELCKKKLVVDARTGGLVIGRSHADGNIYMIRQKYPLYEFEFCSHLEGGEYILNHNAYKKYKGRIDEINSYKVAGDAVDLYDVCKVNILLTKNEPGDKLLLIDYRGQFIVNKKATSKFLIELDVLNNIS